jgi:signal peptidase II
LAREVRLKPSRTIRLVALFVALVGTAGCDQATKHFARTELSRMDPVTFPGRFIELTLTENPGAFLGLGAALPRAARGALAVGVGFGLACLLAYLVRRPRLRWLAFIGLSLIWAGGMSNLIDRSLRKGLVTDFMVVRFGPLHTGVFNVADFAIVVGTLLLIASWRAGPRKGEDHGAEKGASG